VFSRKSFHRHSGTAQRAGPGTQMQIRIWSDSGFASFAHAPE
jgi:hypothetical protein